MKMIFHSIKTIFLFKSICAEIGPEDIGKAVKEIFKSRARDDIDWECSIANPLFGFMFRSNGFLENMQRFCPSVIAYYEEAKSRCSCNQDKSNDSLALLLNSLFPLSSESLDNADTTSSTEASCTNNNDTISAIGNAFVELLLGKLKNLKRHRTTLPREFHAVFSAKAFEDDRKFSDYKNLKLLSIHAYALRKIKTADELKLYLQTILDGLAGVKKEKVQYLTLSDEQRAAFSSLYALPYNFPYSKTKQPLCDQTVKDAGKWDDDSAGGCWWTSADMILLHLCSCLLYDENRGECIPDILFSRKEVNPHCSETCTLEAKEPLFSKVIKFYKKSYNRPFDLLGRDSKIVPTNWVGVLEKIEDYQPFENQGEYSPHKVHYINQDYRYGIRLGIINIMRVLSEIFGAEKQFKDIMESGVETSKYSIRGKVVKFFRDLLSNDKVDIEKIEIDNLQKIEDLRMKDFTGELTISFRLKMSKNLVKMKLDIFESNTDYSRKMPSLSFLSAKLYKQKNDPLAPFDSLDGKMLLQSILKRHVKLLKFENDKTDASGFALDIAFNQGLLWSKKEKLDHLLFLCEYIGKSNIDYPNFIKQVIGNILRPEGFEEKKFRPFYIYSEELFNSLDDQQKLNIWLSFFKTDSESIAKLVKTAWTDFVSKNIKSFDFSVRSYSFSDVASVLQAIKDFATEVKLPLFYGIPSEKILETMGSFLEGNTVLTNLSIKLNQFKLEKETTEFFKIIGNCKTLKALDLSSNQLGNKEIKILADFLATNDTLTELSIANNPYDAVSTRILFDAIQKRRFLEKVIISQ